MIRQLPEVESVRSITSLTHLGVDSLGLEAQPLFTGTQEDQIRHMADQIESWKEVYHNSLISKDLTFSSIVISMKTGLTEQQQQQLIGKLDTIVTRYTDESSILSLVGLPVIKREINTSLVNDLTFLAPIAAILIFFVLTFSLKRPAGILLSFVPAACQLICRHRNHGSLFNHVHHGNDACSRPTSDRFERLCNPCDESFL